jgi:chromosome partitioning protein
VSPEPLDRGPVPFEPPRHLAATPATETGLPGAPPPSSVPSAVTSDPLDRPPTPLVEAAKVTTPPPAPQWPSDTVATRDEDEDDGALPTPRSTPVERVERTLPRVIAVANQKGGVGKTTTTVNLGASLALFGYRVLVVDLDPQGNATTGLGVDGRGFQHSMYDVLLSDTPMVDCIEPVGIENLFVAPATLDLAGVEQELFSALSRELRLKRALATVVDDYDFIFIDCPPSLGLITINAFAAASEILVPVQCEFYALEGLTQLQRIVTLVQRNLNEDLEISTVVLTMYDKRTKLSEDVANEVRRHFPSQTQGTVIPRTVRLSEAPSFGQPITTFDPTSKGARAYKALAREVSDGAQKRAG